MSDNDLKPCPFCGGKALYDTNGLSFWIICRDCGARTAITLFEGKEGSKILRKRWNRRQSDAP